MRNLIDAPLWQADDLGAPIPDSPHAVSACLPLWKDNIGYEEGEPRVVERLTTGYPRFVYNAFCRELFATCAARFAKKGETCQAYPSAAAAERCCQFIGDHSGDPARVVAVGYADVHAVLFPESAAGIAKDYWQHTGEGVSSRLAEACLGQQPIVSADDEKHVIRQRVGQADGADTDDVYLYPCGMAAMYALHRALIAALPNRKAIQFGFPYVDTLKVLQKFGPGAHFFPNGNAEELDQVARLLANEPMCGLYTEFPSNPLLCSPNIDRLADLARQHEFPLIVDDTVATAYNVDLLPAADVLCTSLTKFFSGVGDVTGGALVLNSHGPFYSTICAELERNFEDLLWPSDAIVLEANSRDAAQRVAQINQRAEALADFLQAHPRVDRLYYPKFQTPTEYATFKRPNGGCGGLLSIVLENPAVNAPKFYDALQVSKGPNLGTNYTLACPFTILAHYRELDWAESCGVSRYLVRVSVGLEDADELIRRFERALSIL